MSDGPHKTLPMSRAWKRVASRGDVSAFAPEEVSAAIETALEQDCRADLSPEFLSKFRRILEKPSLFGERVAAQLSALRPLAGVGIGRTILDFVMALPSVTLATCKEAVNAALQDRANRGIRQVEEHFLRRTSDARVNNVRVRLQAGVAGTALDALSGRVLSGEVVSAPRKPTRQKGLDDGVSIR